MLPLHLYPSTIFAAVNGRTVADAEASTFPQHRSITPAPPWPLQSRSTSPSLVSTVEEGRSQLPTRTPKHISYFHQDSSCLSGGSHRSPKRALKADRPLSGAMKGGLRQGSTGFKLKSPATKKAATPKKSLTTLTSPATPKVCNPPTPFQQRVSPPHRP
jgi:hypothetical protein